MNFAGIKLKQVSWKIMVVAYHNLVTCDAYRVKMFLPATRSIHTGQSTLSAVCVECRVFTPLGPTLMARGLLSTVLILAQLVTSPSPLLTARTGRNLWSKMLPLKRGLRPTDSIAFLDTVSNNFMERF